MANLPITGLPTAVGVTAAAVIPVVRNGAAVTEQATVAQILAAALAGLPTTLPGTSGVPWNNGGVICIS